MFVEEAVDKLRGEPDFLSSVVSGLTVSGAYSAWCMSLSLVLFLLKHGFFDLARDVKETSTENDPS